MQLASLNNQPFTYVHTPQIVWRSSAMQQDNSARILIPKTSTAYSSAHLGSSERQAINVIINTNWGLWEGIGAITDWTRHAVIIECIGATRRLSEIQVIKTSAEGTGLPLATADGVYRGQTAGAIMRDIITRTYAQLGGSSLIPGTFVYAPPFINEYDLSTPKTPRQIVDDLYSVTQQEYRIVNNRFDWIPSVANMYATTLIDGVHVIVDSRKIDTNDQVFKITSVNEAGSELFGTSLRIGDGAWLLNIRRESSEVTTLGQALELSRELVDRSQPKNTHKIGLLNTGTLWADIREGMSINVVCPGFGFTDCDIVTRVLSRTYNEGSNMMDLEVQLLPKLEAQGVAGVGTEIPRYIRVSQTDAYRRIFSYGIGRVTVPTIADISL